MTSPPPLADAGHSLAARDSFATTGPHESGAYPHPHSLSPRPVRNGSQEDVHLVPLQTAAESVAAVVAHHVNNLLTPLVGHARLLAERLTSDEPTTTSVWSILESGTRLASLADGLLAFCARNVASLTSLNLATVIREYRDLIAHAAGPGVDVEIRVGPDVGPVRLDPIQFERSLFNLVGRACESMSGRGRLRLEIRNAHPDDLALLPEPMPGTAFVVLEVADNGRGLSADERERMFEPFFGSQTGGPNVGLGLAAVYGMVRRAGGRIAVSSAVGRGTTVRLCLPREVCLPREDGPTEARPGHAGRGTVLVVDDDPAIREYTRQVLMRGGYRVLEAADGEEALQLAAHHTGPIDLLVSDVQMPRVGGRELAGRLTAARPEVRVLFTSGCPDDDFGDHILATETEFLPKPFTPDALLTHARSALSRRRVVE